MIAIERKRGGEVGLRPSSGRLQRHVTTANGKVRAEARGLQW